MRSVVGSMLRSSGRTAVSTSTDCSSWPTNGGSSARQRVPASEYEIEEAEVIDEEDERRRKFEIENFGAPLPDNLAELEAFARRRPK